MADQEKPAPQTPGGIPPKQAPFGKPAEGRPPPAAPGQEPPTVVRRPILRRPGEAPVAVPPAAGVPAAPAGIPISAAEAAKKQTSRLEVPGEEARPGAGAAATDIRTVKVKPVAPPQPGSSPLPDGPKPPSEAQVQAAKSKTSRISLEAALGAVSELPPAAAPKTIRLKRPAEAQPGMGPVPAAPPVIPGGATAQLPTARLPTQHLGGAEGVDDTASITRRKTIKIKRPGAATPSVQVPRKTRMEEEGLEPVEEEELQALTAPAGVRPAAAGDEKVHPAVIAAAVAAVVVALGLAWILAAQTFGPNAAVTGYTRAWGPALPAPLPGGSR